MKTRFYEMINFSFQYVIFSLIVILIFAVLRGIGEKKMSGMGIISFILIVVSGIRLNSGSDYYTYYTWYNNSTHYFTSFKQSILSGSGYLSLSYLIKKNIGGEYTIFLVIALFIIFVTCFYIKTYSPYPLMSILLFMCLGLYLIANNILKQAISMSFVLLVFDAFIGKKILRLILYSILAIYFHKIALVVLLIMFIVTQVDLNKKSTIRVFLAITLLITLTLPIVLSFVVKVPYFSKFSVYVNALIYSENTTNNIKLILNSLYLTFFYGGMFCIIKKYIKKYKIEDNIINYWTNFLFIGFCCCFISNRLFYLNRISFYFVQFIPYLIPRILTFEKCLENRNRFRTLFYPIMIVSCVLFSVISGENNYYNYSTIFSNDIPVSVLDFANRNE